MSVAMRAISGSNDSSSMSLAPLRSGTRLRIIADALDDTRDLQSRDRIAKVTGHGRPQCNQLNDPLFGLDLQRIDLLVALDDAKRAFGVAFDEAAHRLSDRLMSELAHFSDETAKPLDVLVEGLDRMAGLLLHGSAPISRSGR